MPVRPVALAEMNDSLRTGHKSMLADILTNGINFPSGIEFQGRSYLLINDPVLVAAIGRPYGAQAFGEFTDSFQAAVLKAGSRYQQMHISHCIRSV